MGRTTPLASLALAVAAVSACSGKEVKDQERRETDVYSAVLRTDVGGLGGGGGKRGAVWGRKLTSTCGWWSLFEVINPKLARRKFTDFALAHAWATHRLVLCHISRL